MTWNRREKILALSAGGLVFVMLAWFLLFFGDSRSSTQLRAKAVQLREDLAKKQKSLAAALLEAKQLADWQKRALPSNYTLAQSLYRNWLSELAGRSNFQKLTIVSSDDHTLRKAVTSISFTLNCRATLGDVTKFLYEFYSAGHLHQIRSLTLKPVENSRELDVGMTIQALSLPDADRKDQLTKEPGHGLKLASIDDYRGAIAKRDLFTPFREARPQVADNSLDMARFVFVTGFTEVDGARQVWIQDRTAGKLWTLSEGGEFQVGQLRGKVRSIGADREVIIDFDGHGRRLRGGENLRGGVEINEQTKTDGKPAAPAERLKPSVGG